MSIIIFGDLFTFPDGQAATNRVYTYAKGFKENGINVHVICFSSNYMDDHNGVVDGITYYHTFTTPKRSNYFIIRRWHNLIKYFRTYYLVRKINREDKVLAISRWTNTLSIHLFIWLLSKSAKAKLIIESSEHPLRYHQKGLWNKKRGVIQFYIESYLCDGIFCISRYLINFHKERGIKERKLFLLPSTVDPSRFIRTGERPFDNPYIGYFGSLSFKRDSVDLLIKAFAQFSNSHPEVYLVLGGFCDEGQKRQMADLITQLNIAKKVKILDPLTRGEIIAYINYADILVMVRSKDIESDASYPSKLTEFLSTGRPVVTVNVGEIADYLSDGVNAYLVEPHNPEAMADKLNYVYDNYDLAEQAGQRGKELTAGVFNYYYQSKRMIDFINSLSPKKS